MWYIIKTLIKLALVFLVLYFVYDKFKPVNLPELETVNYVNLQRYMGTWYEIARYPNRFQRKCKSNVTADYSFALTGNIRVENSCITETGKTLVSVGTAKVTDEKTNAKLRVTFLGPLGSDYYIIYLDDEYYRYAVVGEPRRKYLWILAKTKTLDAHKYQKILNRIKKAGYDTSKLIKTVQN